MSTSDHPHSKPFVAIMQPSYARSVPSKHSARAFYRPTLRGIDRIELEQGTSMLPRCFNLLLADALNYKGERPITHLAMLHDDIAPDAGWLDILLDELERTGADIISAVSPIKNEKGLTSTAIDVGDPWIVRRLTMHEVYQLPETFEAKDIRWNVGGKPLLVNTGCWLAKFDRAFWEAFADEERGNGQSGFRFITKLHRMPDGVWASLDQPEDWQWSREAHALGQKVVATRKVLLDHEHPQWNNRSGWGQWPTDLAYLEWQRNLKTLNEGKGDFLFPADVAGWLSEEEGQALAKLAADKDVLEIGSYCGRSTICLAQAAKSVCAVDPFDGRATTAPRDTLAEFVGNLVTYGVMPKVTTYKGQSDMVVPDIRTTFDLAFIDGNHTQDAVRRDAEMARGKLNPGGLLAFHDYGRPGDEGVTAAVDSIIRDGASLLDVADTIAVLSWPA